MSQAGKNIRKIRTIKGLSQTAFAKMFDLSRAAVGSYEEGRAEPKLDVLIQIADNYGLSLDDLLSRELSMNELIGFKLSIEKESGDESTSSTRTPIKRMPLILIEHYGGYDGKGFLGKLEHLLMPVAEEGNYAAFEVIDHKMVQGKESPHPGDIVSCKEISKVSPQVPLVFLCKKIWHIGRMIKDNKNIIIIKFDNPNFAPLEIDKKELQAVWQIKGVFSAALRF